MEFSLNLHSMLGNYREASFITFIGPEPRNIHFFLPFPPKEEQGDIDKILELWNILCVGKTNKFQP